MANARGPFKTPASTFCQSSGNTALTEHEESEEQRSQRQKKEGVKKQIMEVCNNLQLGESNDIADITAIPKLCQLLKQLAVLFDVKLDQDITNGNEDFSCLLQVLKKHRYGSCNIDTCCKILNRLLKVSGSPYTTHSQAVLLKELSELFVTKASYDDAITTAEQTAKLAYKLGDTKLEAEAYFVLIKPLCLKGMLKEAKPILKKCKQCSKASGDKLTIGYSKSASAMIHYMEQSHEKALAKEEKFLKIAEELDNKTAECEATLHMAVNSCALFDTQEALDLYKKGLKMAKELGCHKWVLKTQLNLANIYSIMGKYEEAYTIRKKPLKTLSMHEDKEIECDALSNQSADALRLNKDKESLKLAQDALVIAEQLGRVESTAIAHGNIGLAEEKLRDFDGAIKSFNESLKIGQAIEHTRIISNNYCNLGRAHEGKGDKQTARHFYQKALNMDEPPSSHWCETENFRFSPDYLLAKLAVEENDYATVKQNFEKVVDRCEKYRQKVHDSPLKICFNDTQKKPFQYLQHVLLKEEANATALLVGEMGRGRDFYDKFTKEDQSKQLNTSEALLDLVKTNNQAVLFLSKLDVVKEIRIWFIAPDGEITSLPCPLEEWNILLADLCIAFYNTQVGSQTGQPSSGDAIDITSPTETAQCRVLSDDESEDDYEKHGEKNENNGDQSETNAAGNDKASSNTKTTRAEDTAPKISDLIDKFSELIVRPLECQLKNMVSKDGHKPELLIIPQGQTFNIPYAALHLENGEPLCSIVSPREAFSFYSYYYSTTLEKEAKSQPHQMKDILIVGNPTNDLPFAEKEAKMLAKKLGVPAFLNNSATLSEVSSRLSKAPIIHFACHGGTDGKCLILAPGKEQENNKENDHLGAEDILLIKERLEANMVVLSACNTARGTISCEGVLGLAHAFIMAGAKSVVTALWSVNDKATEVLMSKFYDNLYTEPVVVALANAMYEMKAENYDVTQWGGFKVLGANVQVFSHFSEDVHTQT